MRERSGYLTYVRAVRRLAAALVVTALVTTAGALTTASADGAKGLVHVTFVGDSVPASIEYVPSAQRALRKGLDVRLDLKVCRRLSPAELLVQRIDPGHRPAGRPGLRPLSRRRSRRQGRLQRVGRRVSRRDRPRDAGGARAGRPRRRLGHAQGAARQLPLDERRDQEGSQAVAAAPGRRLERVQRRKAVVQR